MKEKYVAYLNVDDTITDFFMAKSVELKTGSNKKQYLDIMLGDKTGEISAKKWDVSDEEGERLSEIPVGSIVKVKALVKDWNSNKQLRIQLIRQATEEDGIDMNDFIKAAPEDPQEMWQFIHDTANGIKDPGLRAISLRVLKDNKEKLMYWPAAKSNHHAELGGLLYHTKRMLVNGENLCKVYTNLRPDWIKAGVIIHDIDKINEIESDRMGISPGYSFEGQMLGHIVQGVKTVDKLAEELGLSHEKTVMLEHMILSHHYEPEFGSPKRPMFPEAEALHYLDIIDARMYDMEEALVGVEKGGFSEKIWVLDNRRIYNPEED